MSQKDIFTTRTDIVILQSFVILFIYLLSTLNYYE